MIRKAKIADLQKINELMQHYGLIPITEEMLQDVCLVSTRGDRIVGFIWGAVARSRFIAYVDYLTVHPDAKGDGLRLCKKIVEVLHKLKVKKFMSLLIENGSKHAKESKRLHDAILLEQHPVPFRLFLGECERMASKWAR